MNLQEETPALQRSLTLRGAITLNLLDMIGVGPFITLPLLLAAMGGPQAMLGWILGALLALCDGMVWAELGAAMPEAGGTYRYLQALYPKQWGRWLGFLFLFQLCFSAPLSIASGCIGLSQYATFLAPGLGKPGWSRTAHIGGWSAGLAANAMTAVAIAALLVAVLLLYRNLRNLRWISAALLTLVMVTIGWSIVTGLLHGHISQVFALPPGAFQLNRAFFAGLASAMLITTYDYWGYYNITFLGGEVRNPGRTIPRAVLWSIGIVAVLYLMLNASILSVLPSPVLLAAQNVEARRALLSEFMRAAYTPSLGAHAGMLLGKVAAVLVMVTAFGSVFSLLLGYSRIPYAAARRGDFFAWFGKLHPRHNFPYVSLLMLAGMAGLACFFSLGDVIEALVVLRVLLQFLLQHAGLMLWRKREPGAVRPFRVWLYPLPPLAALAGFLYIVLARPHFERGLALGGLVAVAGSIVFVLTRRNREHPAGA